MAIFFFFYNHMYLLLDELKKSQIFTEIYAFIFLFSIFVICFNLDTKLDKMAVLAN